MAPCGSEISVMSPGSIPEYRTFRGSYLVGFPCTRSYTEFVHYCLRLSAQISVFVGFDIFSTQQIVLHVQSTIDAIVTFVGHREPRIPKILEIQKTRADRF